jgi:hypothetical protein
MKIRGIGITSCDGFPVEQVIEPTGIFLWMGIGITMIQTTAEAVDIMNRNGITHYEGVRSQMILTNALKQNVKIKKEE